MTDTHDPAGPGPDATERRLDELAERFHRTTAQAAEDYGVALYALEVLASPDKHSAGEQESALRHARRLIDEHSARNAASKEWLELRRRREADGPRADAPVEVIAERYDHPTHPHTHSSDYDADTCDLCFPEDAGPRDPKQAQL